jgi:Tfp pilus assembly protein PilW
MAMTHGPRGAGLVELLVGTALGLVVLSMLTATVASGARLLIATGARGEAEDTAQLAVEAFTFDARRAGWDPAASGVGALPDARPDRVTFAADLDGDGALDAASEEVVAWVCAPAAARLSRVVGRQSLPLADGVTACGFRYLDASGAPIPAPAAGLDPGARTAVRAVALDVTLLPSGLRGRSTRTVLIALRSVR